MPRSAEQQREYRAKQRTTLGDEAYKAEQARARRERRNRDKPQIPKYTEINKGTVEALAEQMTNLVLQMEEKGETITLRQKKNKLENKLIDVKQVLDCGDLKKRLITTGIAPKTAESYLKKVGRVYELLEKKKWNCKDIEWLKDYKQVIDFVNNGVIPSWKTESTRSTHMNHLSAFVMRIPALSHVASFYDAEKGKKNKEMKDVRLEQKLKPEWKDLILPWRTLLSINKTAEFKSSFDEAVYGVFTLIPPRRSGSYFDLQIQPVGFESKSDNYITVDAKGVPKELVLNRYKTSKYYGEYRTKLPLALATKLKRHIEGRKVGTYVFNNQTTRKPYTDQRAFNQATTNVVEKYTGEKIGSTILRISYASYIVFGQKSSLAVQSKHAGYLGHSLAMFQQYARFGVEV
jgi:hypothetical protein